MNVLRALLCLTVMAPLAASAAECVDDYTECKDDCLIEFGGSTQLAMKKKFEKCSNKCAKLARRCNERVMTVKESGLDEGSLDGVPASDEVDSRGLPTRTGRDDDSGSRKKKKAARAPVEDEPAQDEPVKKKEALRSDETPRSARTELKTDEPPPKKEEPKAEAEPKKDVIEMKLSPRKEEEDLRDDRPQAKSQPREEEEPPPPPRKEKKKEEPKKKEEDHDDLRYY